MPFPRMLLVITLGFGLAAAGPALAGPFLSEIYLPDPDAGRPAAVEIDGLAGVSSLSLAVVNARPDSLSTIKAVVELTDLNQSTLLLTAQEWAESPWSVGQPANQVVSPELDQFRTQTELLLFEGPTGLVPETALRSTTDPNPLEAYEANPAVDALAWAPDGEPNATRFAATATTLDANQGDIIVRPLVNSTPLLDQPLIGAAADNGTFTAPPYTYVVSPGLSNPSVPELTAEPIPQPAPALLLALGCLLLLTRTPHPIPIPAPQAKPSRGLSAAKPRIWKHRMRIPPPRRVVPRAPNAYDITLLTKARCLCPIRRPPPPPRPSPRFTPVWPRSSSASDRLCRTTAATSNWSRSPPTASSACASTAPASDARRAR